MKIPRIGKLRPMSIERLMLVPSIMLSVPDKIRLLYALVGNLRRVQEYARNTYELSFEQTQEILAWDIENPSKAHQSLRRGKRGAKPAEAAAEINRHFVQWEAQHGSRP